MKKKELKDRKLSIIDTGRILDQQMIGITGGGILCELLIKCGDLSSGKNSCSIYKNCSWFLNKSSCNDYFFAAPTL